jgi:phage gpG-like protein
MIGLAAVGRVVKDLADALVNRRERLGARVFLDGLKRDVREAFMQGKDPVTGMTWPAVKKPSGRPLIKSGLMMNSAVMAADDARPSGWGVTVALRQPPYAMFHQHGTKRLPQRRFFGVSPATLEATRRHTAKEIVKLVVVR